MIYTQDEWVHAFIEYLAFWKHDGNLRRPHALLTSGMHSDGFFNWSMIAQHPFVAQEAAHSLVIRVHEAHGFAAGFAVDRVIGPGSGAITLADRMAGSGRLGTRCKSGFTEKQPDGSHKVARFQIKGELVLACEDTISTGGSVSKTVTAIEAADGNVLPWITAICNRSGLTEVEGRPIVALITTPMNNWEPEECPLCKEGSEAIRPKKDHNWSLLSADYD
jgi:orotate phosphoribosyltransferase